MNSSTKIIKKLRRNIINIELQIEDEVRKTMPIFGIEHTLGTWLCEKSPVGLCIYDHFEDRALDNCLFCGEPHERK